MSTSNTISSAAPSMLARKRRWPDMSPYGIHFGVVDMPNGEPRLVMVDEQGAWAALAKRMGFSQSRWFGLYVKSSLKLDIPGFATNFPSAKVVELTSDEIRRRILPLILQRRDKRLSQMAGRLSWHPHKTTPVSSADAEVAAGEEDQPTLNAEVALRQTLLVGMNYAGQEVFESGDGQRFLRSGDAVLAREGETKNDPLFLRAASDDDLVQVAAGMVQEIVAGKVLHSEDFLRYLEASHGPGAAEDKDYVTRFHAALDLAMRERIASVDGAGREAFEEALRLHEGRPTFWRAAGTMATPLPISIIMQSLAAAQARSVDAVEPPVIIDITSNAKSHSWALPATSISGGEIPAHDITLAGVFGRPTAGLSVSGVRVTRTDAETLLQSLQKRNADGLTVFLMTTDKPGKLDNEFRRVLSSIGQNYRVCGLTDVDAAMIGPGSEYSSRVVVIGRKRESPDYTFAVSAQVPVIYDYANLWNWGEALRAAEFGDLQTFGDDGREENRWQAPYIPSSQISEPTAMSPRNLLGPVRKALADIVTRYGMGIDELVCDKLGWTMEQLEARLDSEQADAVAIGIQAIDNGMAFVEADATGLGKGRVAATLGVYAKRKGMPVMFMTEKTDLFSDFYRDVADIGSMDELGNPFIINNDLIVRDDARRIIARSPSRDIASLTLACGEAPKGFDLTLATYSQFNRVYNPGQAERSTRLARAMRGLLNGTVEPFAALQANAADLRLPDYASLGFKDAASAQSHEKNALAAARAGGDQQAIENAELRAALLQMDGQALAKHLSGLVKSDFTTLKHQWLYSGAMDGCFLILDESHNAAGEDSHTGVNIRHLVDKAGAVAYSSATFAKGTSNFLLYSRLFPSTMRVATIADTLERGGEPMQEILCAMLAEDGRLLRREHDLSNLEFKVSQDAGRVERNELWANGFAKVLASMSYLSGEVADIAEKMNEPAAAALKLAKANAKKSGSAAPTAPTVGVQYTNFSSRFYNLSRAFSMALNADQAADLAIKALKEGRKPVITVENTMETVLKELLEGVELDDAANEDMSESRTSTQDQLALADPLASVDGTNPADPLASRDAASGNGQDGNKPRRSAPEQTVAFGRRVSFKDILKAYVDSMFSATEQVRNGNKVLASKRISLGNPPLEAAAQELHKLIDAMPEVPLSPIDLVRERVEAAGYSIDEISGRRLRLGTGDDGMHHAVRMGERKKQPLKSAFNNGHLDALALSKSGSTGISLHASRTFSDQSQRELIELQPAAAIDTRLQFWGRVNRKGQVCSPIVHMVSSGLPSEKRLITMQNAKLRRMSANISGNADNSAINDSAPDILNKIGNEVCFRWMEANPKISSILGYKIGDVPEDQARWSGTRFVDMLTGRIMMLDVDTQRRVYEEITAEFNAMIEQFENEGRNPLKAAEFDLRARKTDSKTLQVASGIDSVFNAAVQVTELTYEINLPGLDREPAEAAAEAARATLKAQFGANYGKKLADECLAAVEAMLPSMLPKRFPTIEAALADEKPNAIRNATHKFSWLANKLPQMCPGSIIAMSDEARTGDAKKALRDTDHDRWYEEIYVTGWKIPANRLSLAGYKIEGYSSRTRKKVEMSMSAIMARPTVWIQETFKDKNTKGYAAEIDRFFDRAATPISGSEKRIVLEGNLFRAAEIAEAQKQGAAITYTDEKGVWHHAVLMPKGYTMRNVFDLPVTIDSAETLGAALASVTGKDDPMVIISDDFRNGQTRTHSYRVYGNSSTITLVVPGTDSECGWLTNSAAVKRCLVNGQFEGVRDKREARVTPGMEQHFLEAFMEAANAGSARVLMEGFHREWYNKYLLERTGQAQAANDVIEAAMASNEEEELGKLLAPAM